VSALDFPASPSDGDTYAGYVFNAAKGVWQWQVLDPSVASLSDTTITAPTAGQKLVFDGTNWVNLDGYVYVDTVYYTSSGTFTKATYPWLRAIRVKVQAGGGGGGCETGGGGGGGGGAYREAFITNISGLDASITVTTGAGGAGSNVTASSGATGGASSFGSIVSAGGGGGSGNGGGGQGSSVGSGGDLAVSGSSGGVGLRTLTISSNGFGGPGGGSHLGGGGRADGPATALSNGNPGLIYGGGGSGGRLNGNGGSGANGIVIVELYA